MRLFARILSRRAAPDSCTRAIFALRESFQRWKAIPSSSSGLLLTSFSVARSLEGPPAAEGLSRGPDRLPSWRARLHISCMRWLMKPSPQNHSSRESSWRASGLQYLSMRRRCVSRKWGTIVTRCVSRKVTTAVWISVYRSGIWVLQYLATTHSTSFVSWRPSSCLPVSPMVSPIFAMVYFPNRGGIRAETVWISWSSCSTS
mmetsp:Transcript_11116/g.19947  ORF Transcript_11116/g.19947 Transcript_11116/m.19947 type:complete len:202 (-) Transcript_11116:1380-1985(-)